MNETKYLPIGTICTVQGIQKKVMITGYYSVEYNGRVKMFDYSACTYPEGLLLENKKCSFNHDEIVSIDFMGYKNEEYQKLMMNLTQQGEEKKDGLKTNASFTNIQFDENGVVVYDPISIMPPTKEKPVESIPTQNTDIANPFAVSYQEVKEPTSSEPEPKEWSIFKNIQFDENGVVISAEEYSSEELKSKQEQE